MVRNIIGLLAGFLVLLAGVQGAVAQDVAGVQEHPMVQRYPGQDIRWQLIENYRRYRVPVGAVTGYRTIASCPIRSTKVAGRYLRART